LGVTKRKRESKRGGGVSKVTAAGDEDEDEDEDDEDEGEW